MRHLFTLLVKSLALFLLLGEYLCCACLRLGFSSVATIAFVALTLFGGGGTLSLTIDHRAKRLVSTSTGASCSCSVLSLSISTLFFSISSGRLATSASSGLGAFATLCCVVAGVGTRGFVVAPIRPGGRLDPVLLLIILAVFLAIRLSTPSVLTLALVALLFS